MRIVKRVVYLLKRKWYSQDGILLALHYVESQNFSAASEGRVNFFQRESVVGEIPVTRPARFQYSFVDIMLISLRLEIMIRNHYSIDLNHPKYSARTLESGHK
jgi:hypothetical protein